MISHGTTHFSVLISITAHIEKIQSWMHFFWGGDMKKPHHRLHSQANAQIPPATAKLAHTEHSSSSVPTRAHIRRQAPVLNI